MNSEILQKMMDERPDAPEYVKLFNAIAIKQMKENEKQRGDANIQEVIKIINTDKIK